jgi:hypothetical protein
MMRLFGTGAAVLALILLPTGCGTKGVPVANVRGKITFKGKPCPKAAVSFVPDASGVVPGLAICDDNGEYVLSTHGKGDGAPIGTCKVAISLTGPPPPLPPHIAAAAAAAETMQMPGKPLIPKKYFSPDTSGLKVEVLKGKDNVFDFDLEGEIKP